jgi:uncharacterized protein (UPF0332 family)
MKPEYQELAKYRLEKAHKTLADAKLYFSSASLESTVNRIYYSLFYAVNALLISKGLSSKKHSGVRSIFNQDFVKPGLVDVPLGKFFSEMLDERQKGDYADFARFEAGKIQTWLQEAESFLKRIEEMLSSAHLD